MLVETGFETTPETIVGAGASKSFVGAIGSK